MQLLDREILAVNLLLTLLKTTINTKYHRSFRDESFFPLHLEKGCRLEKPTLSRVESMRQKIQKRYYNNICLDMIFAISPMQSTCTGQETQLMLSSNWIKFEFAPKANFLQLYVLKIVYIFLSGSNFMIVLIPPYARAQNEHSCRMKKLYNCNYQLFMIINILGPWP